MQDIIRTILVLALFLCIVTPSNETMKDVAQKQNTASINQITKASEIDTDISFDKYCNARYGYCIDYPKGIIYPQPESYNGDGRVFKNKQGQEILRVFGRNNSDPDFGNISLEQQYKNDLHSIGKEGSNNARVITYQKLGKTFFVISGYNNGKVFYQKTILKDGAFAYAILQYNQGDKAIFDKVSERIFKSFK